MEAQYRARPRPFRRRTLAVYDKCVLWLAAASQATQSETNWGVVLVTALGGSIIGGVCGGLLTTWLRGRIERDEAWTTRLIDAADTYCEKRITAHVTASDALEVLQTDDTAWDVQNNKPFARGEEEIKKMSDAEDAAEVAFERVRLLFGSDSAAAARGRETVTNAKQMVRALKGQGTSPEGSLANPIAVKWTLSDMGRLDAARQAFNQARSAHLAFMDECERVLSPRRRRGSDSPSSIPSRVLSVGDD